MKLILLQDVKNLGKKGALVEANDGYARNFLIKKGMALEATGKNMNDYKLKLANEEKIAAQNLAAAQELAEKLNGACVNLSLKVGEGDKAFGSVSSTDISAAAKEQLGYDIDKKKIVLKDALKELGTFEVPVKLHAQVQAKLKVVIKAQ